MGRRQKDSAHPPKVRPLDVDGVRTVAIVTVGWGVAFVALALRQSQLNDAGNGWWLWTCLAGVGLGLLGLEYCRKRRDAIAQAALEAEAGVGEFDDDSAVGDWSQLPPEEELGAAADEQPQYDEQPAPASGDHITQPYQHSEQTPGYSTGDMPAVPGRIGSPDAAYGQQPYPEPAEPHTPPPAPIDHEPEPQRSAEWPQPQSAPAPQQQPSMPSAPMHSRRAAQHSGQPQQPDHAPAQHAPQQPPSPPLQPPDQPHQPPSPPHAPPPQQPAPPRQPVQPPAQQPARQVSQAPPESAPQPPAQPEPAPADPYSTGAGWYDSAAGYTPDADRARRHPRDRRPEPTQSSGPTESPSAGQERPARRPLEDSEFFGDDSSAPPPNSTAEFLLADLQGDDEQPPPARHDRDAPSDEYRGRRARGSR